MTTTPALNRLAGSHTWNTVQPITATNKPDMVLAAYEEGLVKTAAQRNEEATSLVPS